MLTTSLLPCIATLWPPLHFHDCAPSKQGNTQTQVALQLWALSFTYYIHAPLLVSNLSTVSAASRVVLERMSPAVEQTLEEHNEEALDNFLAYIRGYVLTNAAALPLGNVLPMSRLSYPRPAAFLPNGVGPSNLASEAGGALMEYQKEVLIASPFVALSGT